jgi:hypothetical protein
MTPFGAGTGFQPVLAPDRAYCYISPRILVLKPRETLPDSAAPPVGFGTRKKNTGSKNFFYLPAGPPTLAGTGPAAGKTTAGGFLRTFEDAKFPESKINKIVVKYLTNHVDYYKVKTHTSGSPLNGFNTLIFFMK